MNNKTVPKAGWLANEPGARLSLHIDTLFPRYPETDASVTLLYLKSYEARCAVSSGPATLSTTAGSLSELLYDGVRSALTPHQPRAPPLPSAARTWESRSSRARAGAGATRR